MNEPLLKEIALAVEAEWQLGGLSSGLYYDYVVECCSRYLDATRKAVRRSVSLPPFNATKR